MNYRNLLCPYCGKKIKIEEDVRVFICPYCEEKIDLGKEERAETPKDNSDAKKRRKKKNSMIALIVTFAVLFIVLVTAYAFRHQIINLFTAPEGHPKNDPAPYKTDTADSSAPVTPDTDDSNHLSDDKIYNFLICGQDKVSGLTDVNLLVSFNVTKLTMAVMQIPRDTNMTYDGYWYTRANGVYSYYRTGGDSDNSYVQGVIDQYDESTQSELRGIAGFAAQLEQNLCVKIHYYAVMDLTQFGNIVDALGGVDMYVPYDLVYEDPNQDLYINVYRGWQTLNGHTAEGVVRYRDGYALADIGRGNMQKLFMASLVRTIQEKANIFNAGKIIDVCNIVADNLVTNMTTSDMIYFANNAMTLDMKYVTFMTAPVGGYYDASAGTYYTCINKVMTLKYINNFFNIYDEQVTLDEFDANNVFFLDSEYYSGPAGTVPEYIYSGEEMMGDGFTPVVGY